MTRDINRRLHEHLSGQSKSTKHHRPIYLASLLTTPNRTIARKLEVRIKNKGAKLFMISNKFDKIYSDIVQYPSMLEFVLTLKYQMFLINNEKLISFPEYAL